MQGKIHKTAQGYNSFEMHEEKNDFIFQFATILEKEYGFTMSGQPAFGLDGVFWDAYKENLRLTVGWDIWSGAFVFAHSAQGDPYIEKMQAYCLQHKLCT